MTHILRAFLRAKHDDRTDRPVPPPDTAAEWWRARLRVDMAEAAALYGLDEAAQAALIAAIVSPPGTAAEPPQPPAEGTTAPAPEDGPDLLGALAEIRTELRSALAAADRSGDLIDKLDRENRALRTREEERRMGGVLKSFIPLYDDLRAVRRAAPDATRQSFAAFEAQALEHLRRHGLEDFEPQPGDPFDSTRAEAVERVETTDPGAEMTIAGVVRVGFELGDRVLRPAAVRVYRRADPAPETTAPDSTETQDA